MRLTADEQGRLGDAELFRPRATFEVIVQSDGSIRVVPLADVPVVKPRRVMGGYAGPTLS